VQDISTSNEDILQQKHGAMDQDAESEPVAPEEQVETQELKKRTRRSRFDQPEKRNEGMDQGEDPDNNRQNEDRKRRHSPSPSGNE